MNKKIGIHQYQPEKIWKYRVMEQKIAQILALNDYQELRLSVLQDYELLHRGISALLPDAAQKNRLADSIVSICSKEDQASRYTLRPEGTISVLHHSAELTQDQQIHRFYYLAPIFRKNGDGEAEESHQLGVELLGSYSVMSDNELISLGMKILKNLGLKDAQLYLNSFGCHACRPAYLAANQEFLNNHKDALCQPCYSHSFATPFAKMNCPETSCRNTLEEGPQILDFLCPQCAQKLAKIKKVQANLTHPYQMHSALCKNFAYYNETVFDFVIHTGDGVLSLGGGGRYDYLSEAICAKSIPAAGFYLDLDQIFQIMSSRDLFLAPEKDFSVYISSQSEDLEMMMLQIAQELQENQIKTVLSADKHDIETDTALAKQSFSELMIVIREENVREGKVLLRNMIKEHQDYVGLNDIMREVLLARKALNKD